MLSTQDLTAMRATLDASFPDLATIQRYTSIPDGMGGQDESWGTLTANVACRLSPSGQTRGGERPVGAAMAAIADWTITLPRNQDVTAKDRMVISGRTFEVKQVVARSWEISRRCYCSEVT